jgi:basic membrane protein A
MDRRTFIKGTGVAGIAGLAGCTGGPTEEATEGETDTPTDSGGMEDTETESTTDAGPAANVGMVYALGGLGDKSFNDAAKRGVVQAEEELGISYAEVQPEAGEEFP